MFGGFDPSEKKHEFLERKRGTAVVLSILIYGGSIVGFQFMPEPKPPEEEPVEVELAPQPEPEEEPEDMEIEEEEEEPEEPPPPPPPNSKPQPKKAKPAPKVETPQEVTDTELDESEGAKKDQAGGGWGSGEQGGGTGTKPKEEPKEAPKEAPKEEAKKAPPKRDNKKPTTLTREDKPAKPDPGNPPPRYPKAMQKRGIEGKVIVKITIDQQARLRKIKFTSVTNNATKESDKEKANEVMKKEVAKALSRWKFLEPCRHPDGKAFTCVMRQSFPFRLKK